MLFKFLVGIAGVLVLGGCAAPAMEPLAGPELWQDEAFGYRAGQVLETQQTLMQLDGALVGSLRAAARKNLSVERRMELLVDQLYGPAGIRLDYQSGHSTGAAQTWQNQRGDCLSLTLLTYAVAQALGIPAQMQEVRVPVAIDRRGGVDFLNGHVNVLIPHTSAILINGRSFDSGGLVIDFEPQAGSRQRGVALTEDQIAARYYNNRAGEYLVEKDSARAYAYYKAALQADPHFSAAYSNLALLYARNGFNTSAEHLLRHALALPDHTDAPLHGLHRLLLAQGRQEEAAQVMAKLAMRQDEDPYYWLGVGLDAIQNERFGKAIQALQRADQLASGFAEIHRHLAYAYWRNDQPAAARKQLAALAALDRNDPGIGALQRKLSGAALVQ